MPPAALMISALLAAAPAAAVPTFTVAPNGDDAGPGTARKPFATLARARDALRKVGATRGGRVIVRGGTYEIAGTIELGPDDSGSDGRPVVWEAARGAEVRLIGGRTLESSIWHPVTDGATRSRMTEAARDRVLRADLRALGIATPPFPVKYHGAPPGPELFVDDVRMRLASWPNSGWATIARIIDSGSRPRDGDAQGRVGTFEYGGDAPSRWSAASGVWLQGYWCYDWYDEVIRVRAIDPASRTITLDAPHVYGLQQGNPSPRRFRALNVLEELDSPGEFVVDSAAGVLYLYPPRELAAARVTLSTLDAPIIALRNASNIVLRGLTVEGGLGNGIEITGGEACRVERCTARNLRLLGISVAGGERHVVAGCDIHHTGTGGLVLEGGDRKTLTPGRHLAENNHIHHFSEHQFTSAYGLVFGGVGNRAANNLIHDAPHQAIAVGGNDHVFEYNEVHTVCTETDDCGALYKGRNPSCRGNIIRFNYWHDIGSPMGHGNAAVYFDDGDGGDTVFGNVFVRCGDPGRGSFGTVFSHGGHGIRADNNIFVDCKRALGSAPWDDARWRDALKGGQDCFFPDKMLKEVDVTKPPYATRYPELVGYMDPPPGAPRFSTAEHNLFVRCGEQSGGNWRLKEGSNWATNDDPGFVEAAKANYALRRDSEAFRRLKGFRPIPFAGIGLRRSP